MLYCRFTDKYIKVEGRKYFQEKELSFEDNTIKACNPCREFVKKVESEKYITFYERSKNGDRFSYYVVKKDDNAVYNIVDRKSTQNLCPDEVMLLEMYLENGEKLVDLNFF